VEPRRHGAETAAPPLEAELTAPPLEAVVFDMDGTLADTERDGHRPAFNAAFAAHGIDVEWSPEEYGHLLRVTGGRRRIAADLRARGFGERSDEIAERVHRTKTAVFRDWVLDGRVAPREGVAELVADLVVAGVRIAVATTGTTSWVAPLVEQVLGAGVAEVVVTGDDVARLKPDPEVYTRALAELGLPAERALAVEDSAVGLRAAVSAGLATLVVTNPYTDGQDFTGAAAVRPAFTTEEPMLAAQCRTLHRRWWDERRLRDTLLEP
jgi:HAD superfamily hydrolase (TIGR01509 family)